MTVEGRGGGKRAGEDVRRAGALQKELGPGAGALRSRPSRLPTNSVCGLNYVS